jgi:DHA1 family inner membrane transport protein
MALLNLGMALAPSFGALLVLRVLCGMAAALIVPSASAVAVVLAPPEKRARALALVIGGTTAAFLLGIPLGSVAGATFGWHGAFGLTTVLCAASALAIRLALPEVPGDGRGGSQSRRAAARRGAAGHRGWPISASPVPSPPRPISARR